MNKNIGIGLLILFVGYGIGYVTSPRWVAPEGGRESGVHNTATMGAPVMKGMVSTLEGKKGEELEVAFLEGMVTHHQDAVNMAHKIKEGSKRPELQKLADDIINAQTSEIDIMKGWLNQWYGR